MYINKMCWLILVGCLMIAVGCSQSENKDASFEYLLTVQIDANTDSINYYNAKNKEVLYQEILDSGVFSSAPHVDIALSHKVDTYPNYSLFVNNKYPNNQVKITFIGYETEAPDMEKRISPPISSAEELSGLLHMFVENEKEFLLIARTWKRTKH